MAKLKSSLTNMILSLTLISLVMSGALGFVYLKTKTPIENANKMKEMEALKKVVPEGIKFDNDPFAEKYVDGELEFYPVKIGDSLICTAVKTFTDKGFSGRFTLMTGFLPDGKITNIEVLVQNETPGLGTKMAEPGFKNQFIDKNPEQFKLIVKKDGGDVDAITAATISSRAFCDAIQKAYNSYNKKGETK
ncbi:MAG: RnfABCDGE type electron transport complex subunit G [Bacteroidales bacterium]|nr:RnfABCDGE type electron transport complex subunit G [Bacteroidales bacterium]